MGRGKEKVREGLKRGVGWGPYSSPGTERKCEEDTVCVPDAQRPERGMEPVERLGCRVCLAA